MTPIIDAVDVGKDRCRATGTTMQVIERGKRATKLAFASVPSTCGSAWKSLRRSHFDRVDTS
jgi:hypothetical protein